MTEPHRFIIRPYYNTVIGVIDFDAAGFQSQIDMELELNVWCNASSSLVSVEVFEFQNGRYINIGEWRNESWKDKEFERAPHSTVGCG